MTRYALDPDRSRVWIEARSSLHPIHSETAGLQGWFEADLLGGGRVNPTVAPVQYIDDSGNIVGLNPEFGDAIAERLCLKQELHSTQFATMIPLAKEGRVDMINSFMFYTPERASQVFMIPYGASTLAIMITVLAAFY